MDPKLDSQHSTRNISPKQRVMPDKLPPQPGLQVQTKPTGPRLAQRRQNQNPQKRSQASVHDRQQTIPDLNRLLQVHEIHQPAVPPGSQTEPAHPPTHLRSLRKQLGSDPTRRHPHATA
jgi:hypothetical protein